MRTKEVKRGRSRSGLSFISTSIIALILITVAVQSYGSSGSTDPEIEETVARLEEMEARDTAEIEDSIPEETEESAAEEEGQEEQELSASDIEAGILDGSGVYDKITLQQKFAGTAIIGDSITEAIWEYGFLDQDVVISQRGLSIGNANDQIADAISMNPDHVFMAFGANDQEYYGSNIQSFIDAYKSQIQKLNAALPGVPVYINCVLPATEEAEESIPELQYWSQYNDALRAMCDELGLVFIDNSFILKNDSSLYEPDGQHPVVSFYPEWLSYMADIARL